MDSAGKKDLSPSTRPPKGQSGQEDEESIKIEALRSEAVIFGTKYILNINILYSRKTTTSMFVWCPRL